MLFGPRALLLCCLCMTFPASAADTVLYRQGLIGDVSSRFERIRPSASNAPSYVHFDELLRTAQPSLSRGLLSGCVAPPVNETLNERLKRTVRLSLW